MALKVAWISFFPVEWLPDIPEPLRQLPRGHPASWQRVLFQELQDRPDLDLHILIVRKQFPQDYVFKYHCATFHCLRAPGGWRRPSLFWVDTRIIRRCLKTIRPQLLHAWGTEEGAALVASRLGYPFFATIQGLMQCCLEVSRPTMHLRLAALLERVALARCRIVSAESNFSCSYLRQRFPRLDVRHIDVVPDRLFHRLERRPDPGAPRLLFVGWLGLPKGGDVLLRALNSLATDFQLTVAGGPDPLLERNLCAELSPALWSRITFKRQLTPQMMADEYSRATLLICPTRADTGPMNVKEAAVAGVPVVGSQVGGIPDYIVPGKNGLLFPSGDVAQCAAAIRQALEHPLFGHGLVDAATLDQVRVQLSPQRMAESFLGLYREIAAKNELPS